MERAFVAQRAVARHCPELLRAGPAPAELAGELGRSGDRLARALAAAFAPLYGGVAPAVRSFALRETDFAALAEGIAPLAANSLIGIGALTNPLFASIEAEAVLRLVERAFGGRGAAPAPLPEAFPVSAELMIGRMEAAVCNALAILKDVNFTAFARAGSLAELAPFPASEPLSVMAFTVTEPEGATFALTLAFPRAAIAALFGPEDRSQPRRAAPRTPAHPASEPFGDMPLTLSAVLVDMALSVSALAKLQPGQIIPVAVARSIPLCAGGRTIAHGTIGAMDDRVAIQITTAF